jgi:hypothetical protein
MSRATTAAESITGAFPLVWMARGAGDEAG